MIIGIDSGIQGAVCMLHEGRIIMHRLCPTIKLGTKRDYDVTEMVKMLRELKGISELEKNVKIYLEAVHSMPKQGIVGAWNFGRGYGTWIGIITALGYELHLVRPQEWKKIILIGTDKSKGASIIKAKQICPGINLRATLRSTTDHDGLAESYLIAYYGYMQSKGEKVDK